MAQRNSSGRGGTATATKRQAGNRGGSDSTAEISTMRVDDIRKRLRAYGVSGISGLRKAELVQALARAERRGGGAAQRATGPSGRAAPAGTRQAGTARTRHAGTARAKQAGTARAKQLGTVRSRQAATSGRTRQSAPARTTAGGARTGRTSSRSVRSSQQITSTADRPERPGRSLVTTDHEVIQRWARARNAKPATISGTERDGRPGVLTFDLPGYRESRRLRRITWDEWFRTFDERRLNLIYQEQLRDGRMSNFFRTESPDREDA